MSQIITIVTHHSESVQLGSQRPNGKCHWGLQGR